MDPSSIPETLVKYSPLIEKVPDGETKKDNNEVIREMLLNASSLAAGHPELSTFLNVLVPPQEWTQDNRTFIQYVSHIQATREDVVNLQKLLNERLAARQAKDQGICPIREELHAQCFDEIIRQVSIDCPERGLLLMRVRDELKMTIAAYKTLYKSAVAFGMRKQIEAQKGKPELEKKLEELKLKREALESTKVDLLNKKAIAEKKIEERRVFDRKERKQEIEFLEYQNGNLKTFLQSIDAPAKTY